MKQKPLLLIVFSLLIIHFSFGQSSYKPAYYTIGTDTVFGLGVMGKAQMSFTFKETKSAKTIKFSPLQAESFKYIDGRYFVSKQINDFRGNKKSFFLEFLVDGEVDLYVLNQSSRFFIKKDGQDFLELNDHIKKEIKKDGKTYFMTDYQYIVDMKKYMPEAPQLYQKMDNMDNLKQSDLVELSTEYHTLVCANGECINYTKNVKKTKMKYRFEALSGVNRYNAYYSPQVGAILYISSESINKNLFLRVGFLIADATPMRKDFDEIKYKLNVPVSIMYAFGQNSFQPIIGLGFTSIFYPLISFEAGFMYALSETVDLKMSGAIDGLVTLAYGEHPNLFDNNMAHTLNIGFVFSLKNNYSED